MTVRQTRPTVQNRVLYMGRQAALTEPLHLRFRGDWGIANLYAICGWLAAGLRMRSAPGSTFVVHTGRGGVDNLDALFAGEVDVAVTTPTETGNMAYGGRGLYREPHADLRAIAAFPHRDRLTACITADASNRTGVRSFADLASPSDNLRIAIPPRDDPDHALTYAIERVLEAHGASLDVIEKAGVTLVEHEWPMSALDAIVAGDLDGLIYEAVMIWRRMLEHRQMRLLPMDEQALAALESEHGYTRADLEPGDLYGLDDVIPALRFADFLVLVRADMEDAVAELITAVAVEERPMLEAKYRHLPPRESPLSYPVAVGDMMQVGTVPLHPGAARYYRSVGGEVSA